MKSTLQILKEARELISDPSRWTQGCYARDSAGRPRVIKDPEACSYCSVGAITKVVGGTDWYLRETNDVLRALSKSDNAAVVQFNDSHTHAEVLDMFDRAISTEEQRASA